MKWNELNTQYLIRFLPVGSKLVKSKNNTYPIQMGDLDGDGISEMVIPYKLLDKYYLLILKRYGAYWYKAANIKGNGYDIDYLKLIDTTGDGKKDLVVGWKKGAIGSELDVFTWNGRTFKKIVSDVDYNKMKIVDTIYLYPASINTVKGVKWGYIDKTGEFIINPIYNMAMAFQENGLATLIYNDLSGIIDKTGKYVVKPKYNYIGDFHENRAIVNDLKGFKVIDEKGNVLFESDNYIGDFQNNRATFVNVDEKGQWIYGYINREGNIVISPKYKSAGNFKNKKAVVQIEDGKFAIINENGKIIKVFLYAFVGDINEGLLPFKEKEDGKFGFIDEAGNVVIPPKFTGVEGFNSSRAVVNSSEDFSNKYGLINKKGDYVINPEYNDMQMLGENILAVGIALDKNNPFIGSKYAVADIEGNFLTDFIYYGISRYENEFASAYDNTTTFFIDKTGKIVKKLPVVRGSGNLSIRNNLIKANIDRRTAYLDLAGKIIYVQNSNIPLNDKYTVKELKHKPNINYLVYYPQILGMKDKNIQENVNEKLKDISQVKDISSSENLDYSYDGNFYIEFFKKNLLVLNLSAYNYTFGAAHGMPTMVYTNVDLKSGEFYELKDLFKKDSDYVKILSDIIKEQIVKKGKESMIWLDAYKGISPEQPFYVTEDALHIYFQPYEIAPYAAGFPTFTILFKDIINIVDTKGKFWNSFH